MSDYGFDTYALDGEDAGGHSHPLEIARELIAAAKPRSALELLSLHHEQLVDDPEYLLVCSEAWWAVGDALRAQQALQGAARLSPQDPRPLQILGELLAERGENERAERLLEKARALELAAEEPDTPLEPEAEDDLIAFAENQEQRSHAVLTPLHWAIALGALFVVLALIFGIRAVTQPERATEPAAEPVPVAEPIAEAEAVAEPEPVAVTEPEPEPEPAPEPEPDTVAKNEIGNEIDAEPVPAPPKPAPKPPIAKAKPKASPPAAKPKPTPTTAPPEPPLAAAPADALVEKELASMDAAGLTRRADSLYAQGHTGVAASYYRRALELDPDYAPALVGIGRGILRAEKYSDAMKNATRALQLARGVDARPGLEAEAIYQMGRVHLARGERDAARRLLRQSISLPGTPPEAWFYLGEALAMDNSPAARTSYERYLELVPKGHLAERARRAIQ